MLLRHLWVIYSFRRVSLVPDLMTPKVWKGLYWTGLSPMDNLSIRPSPATLRLTEASTMSVQGRFYALLIWTGPIQSEHHNSYFYVSDLWCDSVKSKLRNGEILIAGDQWPIFLYAGYKFDPEEPWKGLLRSIILVSVRAYAYSA